jgi:CRISPR-associated protein Cmr3
VKGLECVEEVYGVLEGDRFKVRVENVGLGFSEICKIRRPMLKALPAGTVVKLKNNCDAAAIGILSELGYGSLYRVNL